MVAAEAVIEETVEVKDAAVVAVEVAVEAEAEIAEIVETVMAVTDVVEEETIGKFITIIHFNFILIFFIFYQ